jgi:hypothetical protein
MHSTSRRLQFSQSSPRINPEPTKRKPKRRTPQKNIRKSVRVWLPRLQGPGSGEGQPPQSFHELPSYPRSDSEGNRHHGRATHITILILLVVGTPITCSTVGLGRLETQPRTAPTLGVIVACRPRTSKSPTALGRPLGQIVRMVYTTMGSSRRRTEEVATVSCCGDTRR